MWNIGVGRVAPRAAPRWERTPELSNTSPPALAERDALPRVGDSSLRIVPRGTGVFLGNKKARVRKSRAFRSTKNIPLGAFQRLKESQA